MKCPDCEGSGKYEGFNVVVEDCRKCDGKGSITVNDVCNAADKISSLVKLEGDQHYAWYSAESAALHNNTCLYARENGEYVVITMVSTKLPVNNGWTDLRYCGIVSRWQRTPAQAFPNPSQFRDDEDPR